MYIHTYLPEYIIHTYMHSCMHACIHTYIPTGMHSWMHTYIPTYKHTNIRIYVTVITFPSQTLFSLLHYMGASKSGDNSMKHWIQGSLLYRTPKIRWPCFVKLPYLIMYWPWQFQFGSEVAISYCTVITKRKGKLIWTNQAPIKLRKAW